MRRHASSSYVNLIMCKQTTITIRLRCTQNIYRSGISGLYVSDDGNRIDFSIIHDWNSSLRPLLTMASHRWWPGHKSNATNHLSYLLIVIDSVRFFFHVHMWTTSRTHAHSFTLHWRIIIKKCMMVIMTMMVQWSIHCSFLCSMFSRDHHT